MVTSTKHSVIPFGFKSTPMPSTGTHCFRSAISSGSDLISLSAKSRIVSPVICKRVSGNSLNSFPGNRRTFRHGNPERAIRAISCSLFCPARSSSIIFVDWRTISGMVDSPEFPISILRQLGDSVVAYNG